MRGRGALPPHLMRAETVVGDDIWPALAAAGWDDLVQAADADPQRRTAVLTLPDPLALPGEPRAVLVRQGGRLTGGALLAARRRRGLLWLG
ncbi:MAG TPA: hypothetical protein VNT51_10430, partial [Miltoncostaeaceae bacterium]|nr:hypothetical protein [Miltoncostaeaceae bacterium]